MAPILDNYQNRREFIKKLPSISHKGVNLDVSVNMVNAAMDWLITIF